MVEFASVERLLAQLVEDGYFFGDKSLVKDESLHAGESSVCEPVRVKSKFQKISKIAKGENFLDLMVEP